MAKKVYLHSTFRVKAEHQEADDADLVWEDWYGAEMLEELPPFCVRAASGREEVVTYLRSPEQAEGAFRLLCQQYPTVTTTVAHGHGTPEDWWPKSVANLDDEDKGPSILAATVCGAPTEIAYGESVVLRRETLEAIRKARMAKPPRRASLTGQIMPRLRTRILERDNFRCKRCGNDATSTALEVDHIIPRAKGGTNDERNLQTLCWACNRGKSDSDPLPHELEGVA